jgi:hypothetical protein
MAISFLAQVRVCEYSALRMRKYFYLLTIYGRRIDILGRSRGRKKMFSFRRLRVSRR